MHFVLRVVPLALGALSAAAILRAQPIELPPIFAPKPSPPRPEVTPAQPAPVAGISGRMRAQVAERILSEAKNFDVPAPAPPPAPTEAPGAVNADGALLMRRFVVRSLAPPRDAVEPPPLPLLRFEKVGRVDRRVKPGYSATLARFWNEAGALNFNVVNGAGQGLDHARDFMRAEIEISIRW